MGVCAPAVLQAGGLFLVHSLPSEDFPQLDLSFGVGFILG